MDLFNRDLSSPKASFDLDIHKSWLARAIFATPKSKAFQKRRVYSILAFPIHIWRSHLLKASFDRDVRKFQLPDATFAMPNIKVFQSNEGNIMTHRGLLQATRLFDCELLKNSSCRRVSACMSYH